MFVKNRFCHFRTFPWLLKNICKIKTNLSEIRKASPPPPFCHCMFCNIHHFGITKRKVLGSKLQVAPTKIKVTPTKLQVTLTKLQVTSSKLTSLTAETNKFQSTNMLFTTFWNVVLNARLTVACKWLYHSKTISLTSFHEPRRKTSLHYACKGCWYGFLFARKIMLCALGARSPGSDS